MKARILPVIVLFLFVACIGVAQGDTDSFASQVVGSSGLGTSPYDSPLAVLGRPTTFFKDPGPDGEIWACSMVVSSWNLDPDGNKIITTVNPGGYITVRFDPPIEDLPDNWYGLDFIVFGNSAFNAASEDYLTPESDMEECFIDGAGAGRWEPSIVSVAQYENGPWYDFSLPGDPKADGFAPLQAFAWDNINHRWGAPLDVTRPIDPTLTAADFAGLSVAQAIDLYKGSAGGTAFDISRFPLPPNANGRKWVQYIRVSGSRGEVDAFARVGRVILPVTPSAARLAADGSPVILDSLVVSAGSDELGDCCYAQTLDRACGIRLNGRRLLRGQTVKVYGVVDLRGDEPAVAVTAIEILGTSDVRPLGVSNAAIAKSETLCGMLVTTWGRAQSLNVADRTWLVDDGSGSPVRCVAPADPMFGLPPEGSFIVVTGVCSCERESSGGKVPVIRLRDQQDLR